MKGRTVLYIPADGLMLLEFGWIDYQQPTVAVYIITMSVMVN